MDNGNNRLDLNLARDTCWIRVMSLQVEMTVEDLWGDERASKGHSMDRYNIDMLRCSLKVVEEVATESCLRFSGPKGTIVGLRQNHLARLARHPLDDNPRNTHLVALTLFLSTFFPPAVSAISVLVHFVTTGDSGKYK